MSLVVHVNDDKLYLVVNFLVLYCLCLTTGDEHLIESIEMN